MRGCPDTGGHRAGAVGRRTIPAIAVTGYARSEDRERAAEAEEKHREARERHIEAAGGLDDL